MSHYYSQPSRVKSQRDHWQRVTNTHYPHHRFTDLRRTRWPVVARVVFEVDGEQQIEGVATAWNEIAAYVETDDPRVSNGGVWLAVGDLRRI